MSDSESRDLPDSIRIPFAAVSELGHFNSLHDASIHSAVQMSILTMVEMRVISRA